jgi:hypothetical protein
MRYFTVFVLCFLCSFSVFAQVNLVPNPSFEDTVYCPYATNQLNACANWLNFGNSPDYFNACATNGMNVPNSNFGFQYAHSGNARAGLATYSNTQLDYREIIGIELFSSLQVGAKYYFSFYVNFASINLVAIATDKIGLRFSTVAFDSCCPPPLNNFANLYSDSIISDTAAWKKLTGSFVADSTYNYLMLGNFFQDTNTDTINLGQFPGYGYYYIDDVCVTTDSIYNHLWTGIQNLQFAAKIQVFPNPTNGNINVKTNIPIKVIKLINSIGQIIYNNDEVNSSENYINIPHATEGLYYLFVKLENGNEYKSQLLFAY